MSRLAKAPLIEVIFTISWGKLAEGMVLPKQSVNGLNPISVNFTQDQFMILPGQFAAKIAAEGFTEIQAAPPAQGFHTGPAPQMRFVRPGDPTKIYQIGVGVFCVNHLREGYDWASFKALAMKGVESFISAFPQGIQTTDILSIELRYRDGLPFEAGETALDFLAGKMQLKLVAPEKLFSYEGLDSTIVGSKINFGVMAKKPNAMFVLDLLQGAWEGGNGYILDAIVKSTPYENISFDLSFISTWLEQAHDLQKHSFETVIEPAYADKAFH
jgi:uncharacterized protein (TIGR04255 family)